MSYQEMPEVQVVDLTLRKSARSSVTDEGTLPPPFEVGKVVFAHKGQAVAYWRPGVIVQIKPKGYYTVKFFGDLVEHDCTKSNLMPFSDYDGKKKKSKGSKLFIVPDEKQAFFAKCTADAKKKLDGN